MDCWTELYGDPSELNFNSQLYITCDYYGDVICLVDYEDHQFLLRHLWGVTRYKKHPQLLYPRRMEAGVWIYMHRVIMERTGIERPSEKHIIVDHKNGKTLDCRRSNLRWATPQMNRHNNNGFYARQVEMNFGWQP